MIRTLTAAIAAIPLAFSASANVFTDNDYTFIGSVHANNTQTALDLCESKAKSLGYQASACTQASGSRGNSWQCWAK